MAAKEFYDDEPFEEESEGEDGDERGGHGFQSLGKSLQVFLL